MKKLNKLNLLLVVGLLMVTAVGISQSSKKDIKKVDKCWKVFEENEMDKGIEKLEKYMGKQRMSSLYAHESLVQMKYQQYSIYESVSLVVESSEDDSTNTDSLKNVFANLFTMGYKNGLIAACRRSTLESTSPSGDKYIQRLMIHEDPDTNISEKGQSYFDEAEEFFDKEDLELASLNYKKAFTEDPTFYKATLYYGLCFAYEENVDSALFYYDKAKELQPRLLEPRMFIINTLINKGLYYRAKKECIEAFTVYPGYNTKFKLAEILNVENKYLNEHRILRSFYPNDMTNDDQDPMEYNPIWKDYRDGKNLARLYCDDKGIIEPNGEIEDRYLEVFSMRNMLEKHQDDLPEILHFADKMNEEGYLEPYVFICLFHYDIYDQFKDYMSSEENREKSIEFVEKYIIDPVPSN